jgi:DMSO/TMAO reductase YedYZ molybdopterin-dependent catalytic subunit
VRQVGQVGRREFLSTGFVAPIAVFGFQDPDARLLGTVPLGAPARIVATPLDRLLGIGLGARLFTDLSTLTPESANAATSTDRFFVRTACPSSLPDPSSWTIDVAGLVDSPSRLSLASFQGLATARGRYLLECSGNSDPANYGLLSTADWEGVPLIALLDRLRPSGRGWRIRVSGVDDDADPSHTSVPGASWIFAPDDLRRAMLAVRMNGAPLPRDHGQPVRLIVPGWYGCACIKWVNRIELVADDAPATWQMREFASRTHQPSDSGGAPPALARDYIPAIIDTAAMPVRVEKWHTPGRLFYRVVGVMWGGRTPTNALSIRFRAGAAWTRVEHCPLPTDTDTWTVWTHTWQPSERGRYDIVLRVEDPAIRTRRLDVFFYARSVQIDEVS